MTMNFENFKSGQPAREMFLKLGLLEYLDTATSWRSLRALIVRFNGIDEGNFVSLARRCDGIASPGERVLLHAILHVVDFAWLADELTGGKAWQSMDRVTDDWRCAVAACVGADPFA